MLRSLLCYDCTGLTTLPHMDNLTQLLNPGCTGLKSENIPYFPKLIMGGEYGNTEYYSIDQMRGTK